MTDTTARRIMAASLSKASTVGKPTLESAGYEIKDRWCWRKGSIMALTGPFGIATAKSRKRGPLPVGKLEPARRTEPGSRCARRARSAFGATCPFEAGLSKVRSPPQGVIADRDQLRLICTI